MVQLFKKLGSSISNFGKKVIGETSRAFKKGGAVEKGLERASAGLAKGAEVVGKVANAGNQILNQVRASPLGGMIPAPVLGFAQAGLKGLSGLGKIASAGSGISKELTSGKGVKDISKNIIERVVDTKKEVGPLYK